MALTTYTYSISVDTLNGILDSAALKSEIESSTIVTALDSIVANGDALDITFKSALNVNDQTTLDGVVAAHTGVPLENPSPVSLDAPSNTDKRYIFHSTPRKQGLVTNFTGEGDDPNTANAIGGGALIQYNHTSGSGSPNVIYADFNTMENETHIHKGYLQWKGAVNDYISCSAVPKVTPYVAGTNTNYNLFGGYLIIPAAGDGVIDLTGNPVLVQVPLNEFGNRNGAGYWDCDWDWVNHDFDWATLTPNLLGQGEFNIFGAEVPLDRFLNKHPMLGEGSVHLGTNDSSMMGHNMRFKLEAVTPTDDHNWQWNGMFTLFRRKTV